jgi:hypothetical protein
MIVRFYTSALALRFINFMDGGKNAVLLAIRLVLFRTCHRMDKRNGVLCLFRINPYKGQDRRLIWPARADFWLRVYGNDYSLI